MRPVLVLLLALVTPAGAQENRLWFVDLELSGPLAEVVLDCGAAGKTRLTASLVAGEQRSLSVPLPARVPLGLESLARHPLPVLRTRGGGTAEVAAWSAEQPSSRVEALVSLRARPRPPLAAGSDGPGLAATGLALAACLVAFGLRKRPALALVAGALGCAAVVGASRLGAERGSAAIALHESEAGAPFGLVVHGARDELALPAAGLEVRPVERAIELELTLAGGVVVGFARAPGAELFGLAREPAPGLAAGNNGFESLSMSWTRGSNGSWSGRGLWELGTALPPASEDAGTDAAPPGWLTAGLPPGRGVLLGRLQRRGSEAWIRVAGFQERD